MPPQARRVQPDHVVGTFDNDQAEDRDFARRFWGLEDVLPEEFDAAVEAFHEVELLRFSPGAPGFAGGPDVRGDWG